MKLMWHKILAASVDPEISDIQFRRCLYLAITSAKEGGYRKTIGELFDFFVQSERYETERKAGTTNALLKIPHVIPRMLYDDTTPRNQS